MLAGAVALAMVTSTVPASAAEGEALLRLGMKERCVAPGQGYPLASVTVHSDAAPVAGATVQWRQDGTILHTAVTDDHGVAQAEGVQAVRTDEPVMVTSVDPASGRSVTLPDRVRDTGVLASAGWVRRFVVPSSVVRPLDVGGAGPREWTAKADLSCTTRPVPGALVDVLATGPEDSEPMLLESRPPDEDGEWRFSGWATFGGPTTFTVRSRTPDGHVLHLGRRAGDLAPEATWINTSVTGVRSELMASTLLTRGTTYTTRAELVADGGDGRRRGALDRVVDVTFVDRVSGRSTSLSPLVVADFDGKIALDSSHRATRSGTYHFSFRGTRAEQGATATLRVRLRPKISGWPVKRIAAKRSTTLRRTVTIAEHENARAELRVWNPRYRAWDPVGGLRTIDARGRLTFTVPKVRGTKGYRLVIGDVTSTRGGGHAFDPVATTKTWTVTRR
ncbi:hypothetical protein ASF35_17395 [Aeromicrobium sp. Leaf291]|nr:hypothetical protein ASF35_17395 [Aeromicrobium sp. Leaf291]